MPGTNDFLLWAVGSGANVESQATYLADPALPIGETHGTANSARSNKVWRQASYACYSLGQIIVDVLGINAADDGNGAGFLANLKTALLNLIFSTGDVKPTYKTAADTGWIMGDDGSIGSATSGATTRANADCLPLYTVFWGFSPTFTPMVDGLARGGSASVDFNNNRAIFIPKLLGRALAVAGSGAGLTARSIAQFLGVEGANIALNQLPQTNLGTLAGNSFSGSVTAVGATSVQGFQPGGSTFNAPQPVSSLSVAVSGTVWLNGNVAQQLFSLMQPTSFLKVMIKL